MPRTPGNNNGKPPTHSISWPTVCKSALDAGRDPQQAARQLSRLQADTRRRTLDAGRPDSPERERLRDDERALLQAFEQLPIADAAIDARREQIDAAGKARQAITALDNGHINTAADLMQQAREALDRLANSLPSIADRKKAAQSALDGIRKSQTKLQKKLKKQPVEQLRSGPRLKKPQRWRSSKPKLLN